MKNRFKSLICGSIAVLLLSQTVAIHSVKADAYAPSTGKWMTGEYHTHTVQSSDASEPFMKLENVLNAAFREDLDQLPAETITSFTYGKPFNFLMLSDHLRNSPRDPDGNKKPTARWEAIRDQQAKLEQLQASGKYANKIIYPGFEWDMMGLDHGSVAIVDSNDDAVPVEAIRQFEWLYSYDTSNDQFHSNEEKLFGPRLAKDELKLNKDKTFEAIAWLKNNYPESIVLPNHPSRHNGSESGVVTIEDLRKMNDIAPDIVFGMEGMPGGQMASSGNRAEMTDIYGGADVMIAQVGGMWDALLGEGRQFWNFTNSDHHFKVSSNRKYSSGYWPSEYSRNYTWVDGNSFNDVVDGMRSGKSFSVYGDLIDALDFKASGSGEQAEMGEQLQVAEGENTTVSIRFKSPKNNNYAPISEHATAVTNDVKVDHIDLISGEVTGKLDKSEYGDTTNETTKVIKRFTEADWGKPDADGYYSITFTVPADKDRYYRLRGTNLDVNVEGYTKNGEPLQDQSFDHIEDNEKRFNMINDRNYAGLWFYSNPIFVDVTEQNDFTDVGNHWAASAIDFVVKNELFTGTSSTTFSPNSTMTRGMFATVLHRLADKPTGDDSIGFNDVATDDYYYDAVAWASSNRIVQGIGGNTFAPKQSITREQLALICFNFAKTLNLDISTNQSLSSFTDHHRVSPWAIDAMQWAIDSKLLIGNGNGRINPTESVTRAEVATIVERLSHNIAQ